ncbi:general substrate transporter [Ramaria rubella]|nr:general substrate transporter [Ramaria rubella]
MSANSHTDPERSSVDKEIIDEVSIEFITGLKLIIEHIKQGQVADVKKILACSAAFVAAAEKGKLNPWSKDSLILYCACFIAFLCSCANGYDGSLMTAINAMPFYQSRFNAGTLGSTTGLIFSMYTIGGLVGPFFAGPLTDSKLLGRRGAMQVGAVIICIGSAVIASSKEKPQFIGGRFILGFGVSILTCAAPSYVVEVSPPQWRGRMTAFYNLGWFGGSIPAAAITLGCQNIQSDWSWRLPLIFQAVPSVIVIICVWFLPESPRWLVANSRDAEALDFLTRFHGNGDPTNPLVVLEWAEFKEGIAIDGADKRWWDYRELFRSRNARWRSLMVIMMGCFGQFSGNGLGYFNTTIYQALGYNTHAQFVLNLASSIVSAVAAGAGVALSDRMPRRQALIWGTLASAAFLAINGGLSLQWAHMAVGHQTLSVGQGHAFAFYCYTHTVLTSLCRGVAAFFFFNIVYSFSYTPLQGLYPVEVLSTTARAKGMSMYGVVVSLFSFINTLWRDLTTFQYAGPIALQNIKYNYIFIFVGWDIIEALLWYLLGVETVGRSLEELEELFSSPNPVAASKRKQVVAVKESGDVAIVDA